MTTAISAVRPVSPVYPVRPVNPIPALPHATRTLYTDPDVRRHLDGLSDTEVATLFGEARAIHTGQGGKVKPGSVYLVLKAEMQVRGLSVV